MSGTDGDAVFLYIRHGKFVVYDEVHGIVQSLPPSKIAQSVTQKPLLEFSQPRVAKKLSYAVVTTISEGTNPVNLFQQGADFLWHQQTR